MSSFDSLMQRRFSSEHGIGGLMHSASTSFAHQW